MSGPRTRGRSPRLPNLFFWVITALISASFLGLFETALRLGFSSLRYFDNRPGVTGGVPYATNSLGMREIEFPLRKPPGEQRVLCMGDSTTFGMSERYEDTWPKVAEGYLRTEHPHTFVINGAGVGRHTHIQLELFTTKYWRAEPDVVVLGFCLNDVVLRTLQLDQEQLAQAIVEPSIWIKAVQYSVPIRKMLGQFYIFGLAQYLSSRYLPTYDGEALIKTVPYEFNAFGVTPESAKAWTDTLESLTALASTVRAHGAELIIAPIPYRFLLSDDPRDNERRFPRDRFPIDPIGRLRGFAADHGIQFVETTDTLARKRSRMLRGEIPYEPLYIPLDYIHPSATGYRVIGHEVAKVVAPLLH